MINMNIATNDQGSQLPAASASSSIQPGFGSKKALYEYLVVNITSPYAARVQPWVIIDSPWQL